MNNEPRYMKTPYSTLKAKYNNRSKPYLMIAELIDNSIGSWENGTKDQDLSVIITVNNKERKILCEDNANGMNAEELLDSVELNKEKQGNVMNMFGVGMKNASFWFGEDLTIKTNDGNESNTTSVKLSGVKSLDTPVKWQIEKDESKRMRVGTTVLIENVYEDRVLSPKQVEDLVKITETKYRKYLQGIDGVRVNITFSITDKVGKKQNWALEPNPNVAQIIDDEYVEDFLQNIEQTMAEENILDGLKEMTIEKVKRGYPLSFDFELSFEGRPIELNIGITAQGNTAGRDSKHFKPYYGITAYQHGRAIRMAPTNPITFDADYIRDDIKRVHGSMELGHIFRPDNNKSDFIFGAREEAFKNFITDITKDIHKLATLVKNTIGKSVNVKAGSSKGSRVKLGQALEAKSTGFFWEKFKSKDTTMTFEDEEKQKWTVILKEVSVEDSESLNYFINSNIHKVKKNTINITYNVNHPIWKPLVNDVNTIDLKTVIYPLVTILGLSKIGIQEHLIEKWIPGSKNGTDFLDAISQLTKFGLKI